MTHNRDRDKNTEIEKGDRHETSAFNNVNNLSFLRLLYFIILLPQSAAAFGPHRAN